MGEVRAYIVVLGGIEGQVVSEELVAETVPSVDVVGVVEDDRRSGKRRDELQDGLARPFGRHAACACMGGAHELTEVNCFVAVVAC